MFCCSNSHVISVCYSCSTDIVYDDGHFGLGERDVTNKLSGTHKLRQEKLNDSHGANVM